jgi:3-hydroxyacyl-CoA dehydrogenase/enoyl-CoA hydratase/3-hydroxybutyryl-CoA epimerase/enoyl-CoA isomerase
VEDFQLPSEPEIAMYAGKNLRLTLIDEGFAELCFDRPGEAINKFDNQTVSELHEVARRLAGAAGVRGVLVTSAKDVFIVGADITEFGAMFKQAEPELAAGIRRSNEAFVTFEDLPVPTVVAINGYALGGGFEFALACALRVASKAAQVGMPEVKLGLFPGFGGTVRLSRVAGLDTAMQWIASGKTQSAEAALAAGAVDEVCVPEELRGRAMDRLRRCASGEIDWRARQQRKRDPVARSGIESRARLAELRNRVAAASRPHEPAAMAALELMEAGAALDRTAALHAESLAFARIARTQAASALVQAFLSEQQLKKLARQNARGARPVREAVVLGAGIMGGGIALTSARSGIPVRLKDVSSKALDGALSQASRILGRAVAGGRMSEDKADAALRRITVQTDGEGFDAADIVVEAIVERLEVKHEVLANLEQSVRPDTIIASNTSSLRISDIARPLERPQNFVGMHFFNPVHAMQLVEVVRGEGSSVEAIATAVAYASTMGKTPIVVKDCPGFLVNRVLMAYLGAALRLVTEGADYLEIDRVMESFGWPMGPSYLQDVIGIDTGSHVLDVISAGYPQRMPRIEQNALKAMLGQGRLGQKSGQGFYRYERGPGGKVAKAVDGETAALLSSLRGGREQHFEGQAIVDRLMLPFVVEAATALEEGVVANAAELDTAIQLGVGCPAYIGGPLKYADWLGLAEVVRRCDAHRAHGPMYEPTARMRQMAAEGLTFHGARQ